MAVPRPLPLILAAACLSCEPAPGRDLTVHIGMTASELNLQPAMSQAIQPAALKQSDWLGLNGPLNLHLRINGRSLDVPVSSQGGVQLLTSLGPEAAWPEGRLSMVAADVDPKPVTMERALAIARALCRQARSAGLVIDDGPPGPRPEVRPGDFRSICWVRDEAQVVQIMIHEAWPDSADSFRVLLSLSDVQEPGERRQSVR